MPRSSSAAAASASAATSCCLHPPRRLGCGGARVAQRARNMPSLPPSRPELASQNGLIRRGNDQRGGGGGASSLPLLEQGQGDGDGAAMVKGAVEDRTADDDDGGATTMRQAGREGGRRGIWRRGT
eukprot:3945039-Pyramimonas_sp.AAC.1